MRRIGLFDPRNGETDPPSVSGDIDGRPLLCYVVAALEVTRLSIRLDDERARIQFVRPQFESQFAEKSSAGPVLCGLDMSRISKAAAASLIDLVSTSGRLAKREPDIFILGLRSLGIRPPGSPIPSKLRISRRDDLLRIASKALAGQSYKIIGNTSGARLGLDPEFIHDLRVATRRARTALRMSRGVLDGRYSGALRRRLRTMALGVGRMRDLDVFRSWLVFELASAGSPDAAAVVLKAVDSLRAGARKVMLRTLSRRWVAELIHSLCSPCPAADGKKAPKGTALASPRIRRSALTLKNALAALPSPLTDAGLHSLRIEVKRLRYTLEFFVPFAGEWADGVVASLVQFQDKLGAHQDAVVAAEHLRALRTQSAKSASRANPQPVVKCALRTTSQTAASKSDIAPLIDSLLIRCEERAAAARATLCNARAELEAQIDVILEGTK